MGFVRVPVDDGSRITAPSRAGTGIVANIIPFNYDTESDETILISELAGGSIHQGLTLTTDVTYTLPTAAIILAEWPEMDIGDAFSFNVTNASVAAANYVIIDVGVGISFVGTNNNGAVEPKTGRLFTLVKTSATTMDLY